MSLRKPTELAIRRFFASEYGHELLNHLRDGSPFISRGQPHEVQYDAGYAMGYQKVISTILAIISTEEIKTDSELENR